MGPDDELTAQFARQDWADVTRRLVLFAHRRLGGRSIETAKEIAQEALARVWDENYADWDPAKEPSLGRYLGSVVNGIIRNLNVSSRERAERGVAPDELEREGGALDVANVAADELLTQRIDAGRIVDRFLARTENDELVTKIVMLMVDGVLKPAEQAAALGVPVTDVYNARRRLSAHVGPIRVELGLEATDEF